jgi:hypothetical protein
MQLLFKIAATDDGIIDEEWDLLNKVMVGLKLKSKQIDRLCRRYGPLRSEKASSDKSKQTESSNQSKKSRQSQNSEKNTKDNISNISHADAKYFSVLGIPVDSTKEQVKNVYRILAKKYHPDLPKNANNVECVKKMAEINIAYAEIMRRFG